MAIKITTPTRVLKYKDIELADLNPAASMDEVLKMHASSNVYPELSTAVLTGPVMEKGRAVYEAQTRLGTKG
jgi:PRTRC genetic system protein C